MGGYGSGRRWSSKSTTDDHLRLRIGYLYCNGWLREGASSVLQWKSKGEAIASIGIYACAGQITLKYRHQRAGEDWQSLEYPVWVDFTVCNYGGTRPWFCCPGRGCSRRVAILYCSRFFVCRRCLQLVYESQRESPAYRQLSKAQAIRQKLGGSGSMMDFFPLKPKGMHWSTYRRLKLRHDLASYSANLSMAEKLGINIDDLE